MKNTILGHRKIMTMVCSKRMLFSQRSHILLKIESEHLQVISSKFPKSFRGAGDLVVFYDFFVIFRAFFQIENHQSPQSHQHP